MLTNGLHPSSTPHLYHNLTFLHIHHHPKSQPNTLLSRNSNHAIQPPPPPPPPSTPPSNPYKKKQRRKTKTNKYSHLTQTSADDLDPWERAVYDASHTNSTVDVDDGGDGVNDERVGRIGGYFDKLVRKSTSTSSTTNKRISNSTATTATPPPSYPDTAQINPYDPTSYGFTELGVITTPHGIHGMVKFIASTSFGQTRLEIGEDSGGSVKGLKLLSRRYPRSILLEYGKRVASSPSSAHAMAYILKFDGVDNRDDAELLKGGVLYDARGDGDRGGLVVSGEEWVVFDIVGLDVFLTNKNKNKNKEEDEEEDVGVIGKVKSIILSSDVTPNLPAGTGHDYLEVSLTRNDNARKYEGERIVLIPMVKAIVTEIFTIRDASEMRESGKVAGVWIDPPKGLLELAVVVKEKVRIRGLIGPGSFERWGERAL